MDLAKLQNGTTFWDVALVTGRRAAARVLAGTVAPLWRRPVSTMPARILFAPETLVSADPAVAADIYAGVFALAGEVADASGRSPFAIAPPSRDWERALHGFQWLVHLDANATELSSSNARALFEEWLTSPSAAGAVAQEPEVMAERVIAWLVEAPLLLNGAPASFRQRYMRALARQLRRLERTMERLPTGLARLQVASALALAGAVIADQGRLMRAALTVVGAELGAQILPDGGHRSRDPQALLTALAAVIPLREALIRRQVKVPGPVQDALDRMIPMLRFFRHGDGGLAAFHGAGVVPAAAIDALLAYDDAHGTPTPNARYSGYQRIEAAGAVVLFDTGAAPDAGFGNRAHASALAFEFSHGAERLIVNCGALGAVRPEWTSAARATAAHSTLVLADTSSARVLESKPLAALFGTPVVDGPTAVLVERNGRVATASHDGYRKRFGLTHARRLTLAADGLALTGEDGLFGEGRLDSLGFALRFHLAPSVRVRLQRARRQAALTLPDGSVWLFAVGEGPALSVEESVSLVAPRRVQRGAQLVIAGNALTDPRVRWHLARQAGPLAASGPDPQPDDEND